MSDRVWGLITIIILCVMLFGNRKIWLWRIFKEQLLTFRNAKSQRLSPWDFICFLILPVVVSGIIVCKLHFSVSEELATLLTTVFAIVFTILFGFASVLIGKIDSSNKTEQYVVRETFVSIVTSNILSLTAAILSIFRTQAKTLFSIQFLSFLIIAISIIAIMLLLMVTKRSFYLYVKSKEGKAK